MIGGTIGLAQSAVGFSKRLISDPAFTADVAPTVNIFRVMFPDADKTLNDTYDTIGKQLQEMLGYVKPDAGSQGTAAEVLYGLGQFAPAIGASIIGGPTVGAATAFGSTYEQSYQDFRAKGVDESTARNLAAQQSSFNAAGMALPLLSVRRWPRASRQASQSTQDLVALTVIQLAKHWRRKAIPIWRSSTGYLMGRRCWLTLCLAVPLVVLITGLAKC